jgi:O-antigen/teichoic acid export membrane protein
LFGFISFLKSKLRSEKTKRILHTLFVYMTGQGLVQMLSLSVGLLLLRWFNIENYAQFSVAFGFQTTLSLLTDLGFSGTIIALIGPRGGDPFLVGSYIRAGRYLRNLMLVCLTPFAGIFYVFVARQHHWDVLTSTLLFISIVVSIYFNGSVSYYGAPLLIRNRLSSYYRNQLAGAGFRIVACGVLYMAGALFAWSASWVNCLGYFLIGWLNARESRPFAVLPEHPDRNVTRQMVSYVMPNLPSLIFFAFQGQLSLFLISFFGQTRSIAEVGALGRLSQIFLLLSGFNGTVIEPFIARLPPQRVLRSYLLIFSSAAALALLICYLGFFEPNALLPLLGPKYASLRRETGWLVFSSCLAYLSAVAWTMSAARRWIYWTTTWVSIGVILTTQISFLCLFKVNTTAQAIFFNVATSAAYLAAVLFNGAYGFIRGPRVSIPGEFAAEQVAEEVIRAEQY